MSEPKYTVELTKREIDAILAGLRLLQREPLCSLPAAIHAIYANSGMPLTVEQIDRLCRRINT